MKYKRQNVYIYATFLYVGGALIGIAVQAVNCIFIMRLFDDNEKVAKNNRTSDTMLLHGSSHQSIHAGGSLTSNNPSYNLTENHRYGSINGSAQSLDTKHYQAT